MRNRPRLPPHSAGRGCRWGPPCHPWTTWPSSPSWWGWRWCYTAGRRCDPCCRAPRRHLKRWKHLFIVNAKPWECESCRSTNFRSSWCRPLKVEVVTELHLLSSDDSDQHLMYWLHFSIAALWNKRVHPGIIIRYTWFWSINELVLKIHLEKNEWNIRVVG